MLDHIARIKAPLLLRPQPVQRRKIPLGQQKRDERLHPVRGLLPKPPAFPRQRREPEVRDEFFSRVIHAGFFAHGTHGLHGNFGKNVLSLRGAPARRGDEAIQLNDGF